MSKLESVLEGLKIFHKYGGTDVSPRHDEIYAGPSEEFKDRMSAEDINMLHSLGWDEDPDGWFIFT